MDWSPVLDKLWDLALPILVAYGMWALGRLATALLKFAKAYNAKHDYGAATDAANLAIEYAAKKLADVSGKERMEWVLDYLHGRGIDIDEVQAEGLYQEFARWAKSSSEPAAPAAAEEAPANA